MSSRRSLADLKMARRCLLEIPRRRIAGVKDENKTVERGEKCQELLKNICYLQGHLL